MSTRRKPRPLSAEELLDQILDEGREEKLNILHAAYEKLWQAIEWAKSQGYDVDSVKPRQFPSVAAHGDHVFMPSPFNLGPRPIFLRGQKNRRLKATVFGYTIPGLPYKTLTTEDKKDPFHRGVSSVNALLDELADKVRRETLAKLKKGSRFTKRSDTK
ncbi:MAG: hypothetical protein KatS3mg008_2065 [Acidimicrobiales bacterium]|nr:MAG: hypothetical protein KatS3mg008_2065 [Acidimicrobiales bacterium]